MYIKHSEDVLGVFWMSYVCLTYALFSATMKGKEIIKVLRDQNLLITIENDIHIVNFNLVYQGFEPMYRKKHSNYPSNFLCQLQKLITKQISEILSEEIKKHLKIALLKTWAKGKRNRNIIKISYSCMRKRTPSY